MNYYFQKIENYLGKKHQNLIMRTHTESVCSGSPRSTTSDRIYNFEDDKMEDLDTEIKNKAGESTCSSSKVEDANG